MLKIQLNNSNHRRIEFTEKSSHSPLLSKFPFVTRLFFTFELRLLYATAFFIKCVRTLVTLALVRVLAVRHVLVGYE